LDETKNGPSTLISVLVDGEPVLVMEVVPDRDNSRRADGFYQDAQALETARWALGEVLGAVDYLRWKSGNPAARAAAASLNVHDDQFPF